MIDEKREEAVVRESELQVWREHSLKRAADCPEVNDLEPARSSTVPARDDHRDHRPVAKLKRQRLLPGDGTGDACANSVADEIQCEQQRDRRASDLVAARRSSRCRS